jgi:polyphosphate kinase
MERNLFRRVEVAFPVLDKKIRERILGHLQTYIADTAQSWLLQADGSYSQPVRDGGVAPQQKFLEEGG